MSPRTIIILAAIAFTGAFTWFCPLFRIVPVTKAVDVKPNPDAPIPPAQLAATFFQQHLAEVLPQAIPASKALTAVQADFEAARKSVGRTHGSSNSYTLFLQGRGRITQIEPKGLVVQLDDHPEHSLLIATGMIFGNTVRDGTGHFEKQQFVNSQQANELSAELNRWIEQQVLPNLKNIEATGQILEFTGCTEVSENPQKRWPLKVIPLQVNLANRSQELPP